MKGKHRLALYMTLVLLLTSCSKSQDTAPINKIDSNQEQLTLVWSDEFEYTGLPDENKWSFEIASPGWVNNELQFYTDSIHNAEVKDGAFTITLQKEKLDSGEEIYTSARLVSRDKGDWLYGRFEVRAKLPTGKGTWPAIWMMPTESSYGIWPDSGEIDILEYVGYDPGVVHGSVHSKNYYFKTGNNYTTSTSIEKEDKYHVYAMEWKPGSIEFFLDDESYGKYEDGAIFQWKEGRFFPSLEIFPF